MVSQVGDKEFPPLPAVWERDRPEPGGCRDRQAAAAAPGPQPEHRGSSGWAPGEPRLRDCLCFSFPPWGPRSAWYPNHSSTAPRPPGSLRQTPGKKTSMLTAQGTRRETSFGLHSSILGRNLPCRSGDLGLSAGSDTDAGRLRPFTLTSSSSVFSTRKCAGEAE